MRVGLLSRKTQSSEQNMPTSKIPKPTGRRWNKSDFQTTPVDCATKLIGTEFRWDDTGGIVVETEAYAEFGDEACHTFVRNAAREFVRDQPAGTIYAYLNYGVHWLFNVLTKHKTSNGFVLIRAIEPLFGIEEMRARRNKEKLKDLCSGPGKLTQAMGIGPECHCDSIVDKDSKTDRGFFGKSSDNVITDTRIGITKAADFQWRFLLEGNRYVSRPPSQSKKS